MFLAENESLSVLPVNFFRISQVCARFMDVICPHSTCGYEWTPRKENPRKCPQCQNPLWQSARPKRSKLVDAVKYFGVSEEVYAGSSSVVERPSAKMPDDDLGGAASGKAEGGSSVRIPASPPNVTSIDERLATARARAEELLRKLA